MGSAVMSFTMTSSVRKVSDHFEPEANLSPQEQRAMRGHLEQIDFAAFAANKEVLTKLIGQVDLAKFQRLAVAAAQARTRWVAAALSLAERHDAPSFQEAGDLAQMRVAYDELAGAYEALRRLVERGYVHIKSKG